MTRTGTELGGRQVRAWALCTVALTWVLLILLQGVTTVCALAFPCPAEDVRRLPALAFGGALLLPLGVILAHTRRGNLSRDIPRMWLVHAALVILAVVGLGWTLFSGGFGVSGWVLELGPGLILLVALGLLIRHLVRRRRRLRGFGPPTDDGGSPGSR